MNWKTWVPLVLAIVLGVVAAKAARDVLLKNKSNTANNAKFTKIVVAKGDIQPGSALTANDLTFAQVDAGHIPASSFDAIDKVVGRVSETLMVKGQAVVEGMLAPIGSGSGLQALVPEGMRAITIEVNEFSGVAGLITPGCRVDVIATLNDGHGGEGRIAKTIVQNVKVTAVGQRITGTSAADAPPPPNEMFKSVTVLVSLEDAEAMELACATGRPRLVLRGGRDHAVTTTSGVSLNDLKSLGAVAVATPPTTPVVVPVVVPVVTPPTTRPAQVTTAQPEPARRLVRVIRGGKVSVVSLTLPPETGNDNVAGNESGEQSEEAVGGLDIFESK